MIDIKEAKEKLEKEKEELKLMLETVRRETFDIIQTPTSASDEIVDKYEYQQEKHLQEDVFRERLNKIERALKRIEDGTYYFCQKCGKEIEETRLKIDPAVAVCRKCSL